MRILHTSDWHLGIQLHGMSLLEEQQKAAKRLLQTVKEQQVDAVIFAGDLFDHAVAKPEAIALYSELMQSLCLDCGVRVLLCAGNHDGAARLSACSGLLRRAGLYLSEGLSGAFAPVVLEDTAFFLLPWFSNDQARALFPDATIRTAADAMQIVCDRMRELFLPDKRNVLIAHCFAAGGQTSESDRSAELGGAGRIALAAFDGFDYVALGHLHRAQQLAPHIRYSGTPYPYSFTEAGQDKTFTLLDTDTMTITALPALSETGRTLRVLRGSFEQLRDFAHWDTAREDYLAVTLTDCPAGAERLALLREDYPHLLLLEGTRPEGIETGSTLTTQELSALTPEALLTRFCEETAGFSPDEEQLRWFAEAFAQEEVSAV